MAERDSFIIYRSFIESARELSEKDRLKVYEAMFDYGFEQKETELKGMARAIFTLIKPQLEANYRRYVSGCKGGAPLNNQNATKKQPTNNQETTEKQPNDNDNVNVNVNDNGKWFSRRKTFGIPVYDTSKNKRLTKQEEQELLKLMGKENNDKKRKI